eukprot:SAG31_NODE_3089_length_4688_cov_4.310961_2_plen_82_part_00
MAAARHLDHDLNPAAGHGACGAAPDRVLASSSGSTLPAAGSIADERRVSHSMFKSCHATIGGCQPSATGKFSKLQCVNYFY